MAIMLLLPTHPSTVSSFMNHNFLGKRECPGHSRRLLQSPPWTRGTSAVASRSSSSRTRTPKSGWWTVETSCPGSAACLGSLERFRGLQRRLPRRQTTWNWQKGGLQFQWQLLPSTWRLKQALIKEAMLRLLQLQVTRLSLHDLSAINYCQMIAGVAETTLKQCYKLILPRAGKLFPANFSFVTPVDQLPLN